MSRPLRDEALEALLYECLERIEEGDTGALEALSAAHPERAAALREAVAALVGAGLLVTPFAPGDAGAFPERLGEFRLLKRLGGGGMGVVFLAEQPSIGRDVALKLIRPDQLYFPKTRERFQREVEAIARLAHPGIVQVHSVGEDKGIPYFAMEYVRGVSLAQVIAALQGRRPEELRGEHARAFVEQYTPTRSDAQTDGAADALFVGPWAMVATRIALLVARAVEHAHERGVLHRDLKPSNIMLTPTGRIVLLDFGLASLMGADRITRTGSQLGSVPYMAPEQLRGEVADIGARTDVYALGVVLYELSTLSPAYQDDTNSELLRRKIIEGRATPVSHLNPALSRDVATVIARAMAPEVAARYASARALADDLQAILSGRSIAARPPGPVERITRWVRRSPARAAAYSMAVLLFVGGPLGFARQQARASEKVRGVNVELSAALARVESESAQKELERKEAERNLRKAVAAVDTMLTRVGQESLKDVPQMVTIRKDLLQDALDFYSEFLQENESDSELRRSVVLARVRVAGLRAVLGETDEVVRDLGNVVDEVRAILAAQGAAEVVGDSAEYRIILARALSTRSEALTRLGRGDEAEASASEAVEALARVPTARMRAPELALSAANYNRLCENALRRGDLAAALASIEHAVEIGRGALDVYPDDSILTIGLGRHLDRLGGTRLRLGNPEGSRAALEEAVALLERYHAARPLDSHGREKLMAARVNLANTLNTLNRFADAEPQTDAAVALGDALVSEFPDVPSYRAALAVALNQRCFYEFRRGDLDAAASLLQRALEHQEVLAREGPPDVSLLAEMATAYGNLSGIRLQQGDPSSSLDCANKGIAAIERALSKAPKQEQWRMVRSALLSTQGLGLVKLGRWQDAVATARAFDDGADASWIARRAWLLERCARLAAADASLSENARQEQALQLRNDALASLTLAVERGHADWSELEDPDEWASLRSDPAFQALVGSK
ncbi:MAG: protein kinase [Planctomycetota bacterium]